MADIKTLKIPCYGYDVEVDYYPVDDSSAVVLFLPGWPATKSSYRPMVQEYQKLLGMEVYVIEYSGISNTQIDLDKTCPAQHFMEVVKLHDHIKEASLNKKLIVIGTSYGGYLATQLTKYRGIDILVLRIPGIFKPEEFYSTQDTIDREWTKQVYRKDAAALAEHPLLHRVKNFRGQALVVSHSEDRDVPKPTTDAYAKALNAQAYVARGFPHSLSDVPPQEVAIYQKHIAEWILSAVNV